MALPTLIFCGGNNRRFAKIAIAAGFKYGSRLPGYPYAPLYFADQNWHHPDRDGYMRALAYHRPYLATTLDWEHPEQLPEILDWAEEVAQYCEELILIPKVSGIDRLPRQIGGKPVRLGYSVPTQYGGTSLWLGEFLGWPVHLLGGSPHAQINLWRYLNVVSTDGNMMFKMATRLCAFYSPGFKGVDGLHKNWPMLNDADGHSWGQDAPYEAFRRSCHNILAAWKKAII